MSEIESVGEAVTGGLVAAAVEPDHGDPGKADERACLNCGTPLSGPYCHACGQKAHVHRSLRSFASDFAAGVLNFEGKFWRTLPMLAWRPGELTRRYIDGERARFISPIALYLFTVFLMFATLGFSGALDPNLSVMKQDIAAELKDEQAKLAKLEREKAAGGLDARAIERIDRRIARRKEDIERLEGMSDGKVVVDGDFDPDTPAWARQLVGRVQDNPEQTVAQVQDAASKFSWLLIPLSLPFMWLLFPFYRRFRMYDHTVFVTYSLAFMMLLVVAAGLLVSIGWTAAAGFLFFVPPVHLFWQLRGTYQLGWFSALVRTTLLVGFCFAAAGLFAAAMVAIGIF